MNLKIAVATRPLVGWQYQLKSIRKGAFTPAEHCFRTLFANIREQEAWLV